MKEVKKRAKKVDMILKAHPLFEKDLKKLSKKYKENPTRYKPSEIPVP